MGLLPSSRLQQRLHRLHCQYCRVLRFGRESPHRRLDVARGEPRDLRAALPGQQFCQRLPGRDGSRAPPRFVPDLRHAIPLPARGKPQDIPARRIHQLYRDRRRWQLPHVTGVLEVVEQPFAIHARYD